tara:strand:- start:551 stop:754 length:204 start_codon:yes stop_codon:yes gene_type:complete
LTEEENKQTTRTTKFAEWLMAREERRQEKETNLEGLVKLNVMVSFLTLGLVGGFEAIQLGISLVPYI